MDDLKFMKIRIFEVNSGQYSVVEKVIKSEDEWRKILSPVDYAVMRGAGTERAFCQLPMNKEHRTIGGPRLCLWGLRRHGAKIREPG